MRVWAMAVLCGCVRAVEAPAPPPRVELWVDASAPEGGDGSPQRPLKALAPVAGAVLHLATGLYPFSGVLPDGCELRGGPAVVLTAGGEAPFVVAAGDATLRELTIQGGQVGLVVNGTVTLENVSFSGQRRAAIEAGGELRMTGGTIEGTVSETLGVVVAGFARLEAVRLRGALRRGVEVRGEARLLGVDSQGPNTVLQVGPGKATVERTGARGGRGPAFFVSDGSLRLREVTVSGHEYAVLTGAGGELTAEGVTSDGAQQAAFGLVAAKSVIRRATVTRPGPHGAVESLAGSTWLEDVTVKGASELGVLLRHGRLEALRLTIDGVKGGDAVMLRDGTARLLELDLRDVDGAGVIATAYATAELQGLECLRCAHGALVVERGSSVKARAVVSEGAREAAVTVPDDGQLELEDLWVKGEGPGVWAECAEGSRVVLRGRLPPRELMSGRCLEFPRPPSAR